jgi:hypothetical protein
MNALKPTLLSLILVAVTAGAHAADTPKPLFKPLRPVSSCIRTDRIDEWHIVDARTAIVRTGPQRYVVKLQNDCPRLGIGRQGLIFRANEANQLNALGRICGEAGESVRSRDQPPCALHSVRIIDKPTFDKLSAKATRHGNGAEPNGNKP